MLGRLIAVTQDLLARHHSRVGARAIPRRARRCRASKAGAASQPADHLETRKRGTSEDQPALARPATRGAVASRRRGSSCARTADARRSREYDHNTALHERASELVGGIDAASAPAPRRSTRAAIRRQRAAGLKIRVRRYRLSPVCHPARVSRMTLLETCQIAREIGGEGQNRTVDTTIFSHERAKSDESR